jgi:hypothetical protein
MYNYIMSIKTKQAWLEEDPLEATPFGGMSWFQSESGWTRDKAARLCREGLVPGAMQAQPGTQGSHWTFRKAKTLRWLRSLERK